jgi:hypothetical protein
MKTLSFRHANTLSALHDQLLAALPGLRGEAAPGEPLLRVEGRDDDLWLTVPDETDDAAVAAVVAAHVPTPLPDERALTAERHAATDNLRTRAAAALTRLDALNTDPTMTDTAAKVRQGLRDVAQIVHAMLRRDVAQMG